MARRVILKAVTTRKHFPQKVIYYPFCVGESGVPHCRLVPHKGDAQIRAVVVEQLAAVFKCLAASDQLQFLCLFVP